MTGGQREKFERIAEKRGNPYLKLIRDMPLTEKNYLLNLPQGEDTTEIFSLACRLYFQKYSVSGMFAFESGLIDY